MLAKDYCGSKEKYFFGAIRFNYIVEDRLPVDANYEGKYKHICNVTVLGKRVFSSVHRANQIGFVSVDGKDITAEIKH